MKKTNCFRWFLIIGIGIAFTAMGCTRSFDVAYKMDMASLTSGGTPKKDVTIGIAKFDDLRTDEDGKLVKGNKPKNESYIAKMGAWRFGITYQGEDYSPVKDIIQKIFVDEFKNAGFTAKPIDEVLSKKNKQDFQMIGKKNGVDYIIGGDIVNFKFRYDQKPFWFLIQERTVSLNAFLMKQGKEVLLDAYFTETNKENAQIAIHSDNAEKLINIPFRIIVMQVIQNVEAKLHSVPITAEEILLLKKAGVPDEKIFEMQKKEGTSTAPVPVSKINPYDWNEDGKKDIIAGSDSGKVYVYLNKGTNQQPVFDSADEIPYVKIEENEKSDPFIVDWNDDGKNDILVGQGGGEVFIFINRGTNKEPLFGEGIELNDGKLDAGSNSSPAMVDWNGDGKKDLIVGNKNGNVLVFINIGEDHVPIFDSDGEKTSISVDGRATPFIADWNNDGKFDVVSGSSDGRVYIFINEGDSKNPKFGKPQMLQVDNKELKLPGPTSVIALDWDDDGKIDLLVSNKEKGNVGMYLLLNTGTKEKPEFKELKQIKGKFKDDAVL